MILHVNIVNLQESADDNMAGLYIHIPYCHSKCIYCDFYSTPHRDTHDDYVSSLLTEYDLRYSEIKEKWTTIYIGGGTPSVIPMPALNRLIDGIKERIDASCIEEWTIEANPEDVTGLWVQNVVSRGISRVSLGIQSFNDKELAFVKRVHSASKAIDAIELLRENGISEISGDLIYGLPGQSFENWKYSLGKLLSLGLPHFSAYLLSYENGTRLYAMLQRGKIEELSEDEACERYHYLCDCAHQAGYEHYEISNFSLPGHNAIHNSNYWSGKPYLGLGVSAHSFDGRIRRYNGNDIKGYITSISRREVCCVVENETDNERHNDYVITALRTSRGIDIDEYRHLWGEYMYSRLIKLSQSYLQSKMMLLQDGRLMISELSMLISDRIMVDFII